VVQTGLHASLTHLLPGLHCPALVHCTQEPVVVSQCGVCGRDVQEASEVHLFETQVFCGVHTCPDGQVLLSTQATQVFVTVLHAGVGGAQLLQPLGATQVWSGWQTPPFGQSGFVRQATQTCGVAPISHLGVGAAQSASPVHCLTMQVFCGVHTSPEAHCVSLTQATQVPGLPPVPGRQCGADGFEAQSFSTVQVVALGCWQTCCT
jgi:hypothetical protein